MTSLSRLLLLTSLLAGVTFSFAALSAESRIKCPGIPFTNCADTDLHEGRLRVPLDWYDRSDSRQLEIKYRIIGYRHTDRPFLFMIGGGPGLPSVSSYFLKEWFQGAGLANHYRLVVFDQRGNGQSSPLLQTSPELTPEIVARYFSQRQIVNDLGYLISTFGRQDKGFVIMAHSAGGVLLSQYLVNPAVGPRPSAVIYANSIAGTNPWSFMTNRFQKQIDLNQSVMTEEMKAAVLQIRARIRELNKTTEIVPEGFLDARFDDLAAKDKLAQQLEALVNKDLSEEEFIKKLSSHRMIDFGSNRFMATLSATLYDGRTDLQWAEWNNSLAPQEAEWMLLERRSIKSIMRSEWIKKQWGADTELQIRIAAKHHNDDMATIATLKEAAQDLPVLVLLGDQDQYVDEKAAIAEFREIFSGPKHWIETIEGGDHFSSQALEAAPFIVDKLKELGEAKTLPASEPVVVAKKKPSPPRDRTSAFMSETCGKFLFPTRGPWPFPTHDGRPWHLRKK